MNIENHENHINETQKLKPKIKILGLVQILKQLCKSSPVSDLDYERWEQLENRRKSNPEIYRHEMRNH